MTIVLFVTEIVRVDIAAVCIVVLLGLTGALPGIENWVSSSELFDGFGSNAVVSIIAVMILGAGLDRTGVMSRVAKLILKYGGKTERRLIPLVSGAAGLISAFMQNVGAAALFIPVVSRTAARTGLPMSRLLMPMGFCAILGGTVTMVGSSPLILLNDLIANSNTSLPPEKRLDTFALFDVTPVGLALLATGILYFILAGRYVLPAAQTSDEATGVSTTAYFKRVYGIEPAVYEVAIPIGSEIVGKTLGDVERGDRVRIIATNFQGQNRIAPARDIVMDAPAVLAVMAAPKALRRFVAKYELQENSTLDTFSDLLIHTNAGISELVIPPDSDVIGHTPRELLLRKTYGLSLLAIHRGEETITDRLRDVSFRAGDTLVCHNAWNALARLERDPDFVVVTSEYPHEEFRPDKTLFALLFFLVSMGLILFTDLRLSLALLTGAVGMVVTRVLSMDEAYDAVSWKTVFLLACLIPLGRAVEVTGTAEWIAVQTLAVLGDTPTWVIQAALAGIATLFTLVMSNVGAAVLLVPLAINIAIASGGDPALFALTVAIATSNSFLIPTHQVNALIMGPGSYRVVDFMRAGGIMTVLFLIVSVTVINFLP